MAKDRKLKVRAGRIRWWILCSTVTWSVGTPFGTLMPMGNQPSFTENTMRNTIPIQKVGIEHMMRQTFFRTLSGPFPWKAPITHPTVNPMIPENSQAAAMSAREVTNFSLMISSTGLL